MRLPPYKEFPELISDGIVLRKIQPNDIVGIIEISFYDGKPALTPKDAIEMQYRINMDYNSGSSIHWGIAERNTDEIIGTVGYYRGFGKETGELGFFLKRTFWGRGFMTMAMRLAVEFGIEQIGLTRVIAITGTQNDRARKLLERLKFVKTAEVNEGEYQFVRQSWAADKFEL